MNTLYGRLGMNPEMESHQIIDSTQSNTNIYIDKDVSNVIDLLNGKELISFLNKNIEDETLSAGYNFNYFNTSIPIAAAITAYARIHMSKFKNLHGYKLYYTDTDSAFFDKPLPDNMVGDELGSCK